jgi:hypothetical protein
VSEEILIDDRAGQAPRNWDFFLTVLLLIMLLVMTGVFVLAGFGFGVRTIGCADDAGACNSELISLGSLLAVAGTPIIALAAIIVSVIRIARRKLSFLVPIIGIAASVLVFLLGSWLLDLAVPA